MPWGAVIGGAATIAGGVLSGNAASNAADAQQTAAQAQLAQQNAQFQQIQQLLSPYVSAGNNALSAQGDLLGLNGADKQGAAYSSIQNSPAFQSLLASGQNSILQNASATGGLRGGNTQAALAQYSPSLLSGLIQQQFGNLGGLTSVGQNAAARVGNAGMQTGNNITSILGQQGQISAGDALAQGRAYSGVLSGLGQVAGAYGGYNGFGGGTGMMSAYSPYSLRSLWGNSGGVTDPSSMNAQNGSDTNTTVFSDIRLKKNVKRIGTSAKGNPVYSWDWLTGGKSQGVIAQEVAHIPGAVKYDPSGFLTVDYSKV